jgi:hypothetical protein
VSGIKATLNRAEYVAPKPTISLSSKDLPEIADWKVGNTYEIVLTVKQTELRQGSEYDDWDEGESGNSKTTHARFKIMKVKPMEDK